MELSDTNLYSVTQYQVINGIIIRPLHFWRQILFQNLNRLVVCAAHIAYRTLINNSETAQTKKKPSGFFPIVIMFASICAVSGAQIRFFDGLVGVKYAPVHRVRFCLFWWSGDVCVRTPFALFTASFISSIVSFSMSLPPRRLKILRCHRRKRILDLQGGLLFVFGILYR